MADSTFHTQPKRWAILIGINYYMRDSCLQGCVRDVEGLEKFLQSCSTPPDITLLRSKSPYDPSPPPDDMSSRMSPAGQRADWPTRQNIEDALSRVTENAAPGDYVYIHYSGHGTRQRKSVDTKDASQHLALVVLDDAGQGDCYLYGEQFRQRIDRMVAKGLVVTIVLDCCFSGSVIRGHDIVGTGIRTVEYDPAVAAATASTTPTDVPIVSAPPTRDSIVIGDWLIDPQGYTILSACGPYEEARELQLPDTGGRNGALSYFLLEALQGMRARSMVLPHEDLYEDLRIQFRQYWPAQTPMRYGNRRLSFFSQLSPTMGGSFFRGYFDEKHGCLRLDAGEAHGICRGDEFELYPLDSLALSTGYTSCLAMGRVQTVRHLTSDMDIGASSQEDWWEEGYKAKLITSLSPRKISIRLLDKAHTQFSATRSVAGYRYLKLCDSTQDAEVASFNVRVGEDDKYEILDTSLQKMASLPTVPLVRHDELMRILQQLAQFRYMERLENRNSGALNQTSVRVHASVVDAVASGDVLDGRGVYRVKHNGQWRLSITNMSQKVVYIALFDMTPAWAIVNMLSEGGGNAFLVLVPGETTGDLAMEMSIPNHLLHQGHCEDTIKLVATSRPTAFPSMILTEIASNDQSFRGTAEDTMSSFLSNLTESYRGSDEEDWTTCNFIVRTEK